jgi:hypothetical protein
MARQGESECEILESCFRLDSEFTGRFDPTSYRDPQFI